MKYSGYSVDTSALLDGWRRYYPPDVFPLVWKRLEELIEAKILIASQEVLIELKRKDDDVYRWALNHSIMFISSADRDIQVAVSEILSVHPKLIDERKNRSGADPWVIAVAKVRKSAVITGEAPSRSGKRPHIPDVCESLKIPCYNMLQLFRDRRWVFA